MNFSNLKYFLYSFCCGELYCYKIFDDSTSLEKFLKENEYLEDLQIIFGWDVTEIV